jgi:hypothetical protein
MLEMFTAYLTGVVAVMIYTAVKAPDNDMRPVLFISLAWPITIPFILLILILDKFSIEFDIAKSSNMFGIRKSPMQNVKGFGVSIFYTVIPFI